MGGALSLGRQRRSRGTATHAAAARVIDVATYQPYWALRGHLLKALGRTRDAREAYERAVGLGEDPAVRAFLLGRCA